MKTCFKICLLFSLLFFFSSQAFPYSSYPIENYWCTDGIVRDLLISGNTLYIGGDFNTVGRLTGSGAPISVDTAQIDFPCPVINGIVYVAIADANGGWFVGGNFTNVGYETRMNCVHILSNGTVDPDFNISFDSAVTALALSPNGKILYAAGNFAQVENEKRKRLAAIDIQKNSVLEWAPEANNFVNVLAVSPDGKTVYIGGAFTKINSTSIDRIAAIDAQDGSLKNWNPSASGEVYTIAVSSDGLTVYVGGNFTKIGDLTRKYIAAINAETGAVTNFDPSANLAVNSIILNANKSLLYVAGNFTQIGGETRKYLASMHIPEGTVTTWNPSPANGAISCISLSKDGNKIFAAGKFTAVASVARRYLAQFNALDGSLVNWVANCSSEANTIAVSSNDSKVFAGGTFFSIGCAKRSKLAAINIFDDEIAPWNPSADNSVYCLEFSHDKSFIYAGGAFTEMGAFTRNRIAKINAESGEVSAWNPSADGVVKDIQASSDGKTIYAAGNFTSIGGASRKYIASLNAETGAANKWDPSPDKMVNSIQLSSDDKTIYVGGAFLYISGQKQSYITALETKTAASKAWENTADGVVHVLELSSNNNLLFAGGDFTSIGGQSRNRIASILTSNGSAYSWNPGANNTVYSLMLSLDGSYIFSGGNFSTIGGVSRTRMAQIETSSNKLSAWSPTSNGSPFAFAASSKKNTLFAAGNFTYIAGQLCPYLAAFENNSYHLTVEDGVGDGNYTSGTVVEIVANIAPQGHYFDKWTGNTAYVQDVSSARTTVIMPSSNVTVTATYKPYTFTVTFTPGQNGKISGKTLQTIPYGSSTSYVKAVPNPDYMFDSWTGTDGFFSKANPLIIKNVKKNMNITANFVPAVVMANLTVNSVPPEGGTTSPAGTSQVIVNRYFQLTATPSNNYYFLNWEGSKNVEITNSYLSNTTAKIYGDGEITAKFAIIQDQANLTMEVFPAGAGETTPSGVTTVKTKQSFLISAVASERYYFYCWIFSSGAAVITNPLAPQTNATIYGDCTIIAVFVEVPPENYVSIGKIYNLLPDKAGLANFAKNPSTYCAYTSPISKKPDQKAALKTASKNTPNNAALEWTAKVALLSNKVWTQDKTATCFDVLSQTDPKPLDSLLFASGQDSSGQKVKNYKTGIELSERLPEIYGVFDENGNSISCAKTNQKIIIKGTFFGKSIPQIWIEYRDAKGNVKKLNLKPDKKNLKFKDYYGKPSCMNFTTGESEISAKMPSKLPKKWTHVGDHNIVINNKICRATIIFSTTD